MAFELYCHGGSFYSQKAKFALQVKGVDYTINDVDIMKRENLQPWFLKINPAGKVPTLKHGDTIIADSSAIITYLDKNCEGPKLHPDPSTDLGKAAKKLYDNLHGLKIEVLTMGTFLDPEDFKGIRLEEKRKTAMRDFLLGNKVKDILEGLIKANPDMEDYYKDRLTRAQQKPPSVAYNKQNVKAATAELMSVLNEVEQQLSKAETANGGNASWLFGPNMITAADIQLMMTLFRLTNVGRDKTWAGKLPKTEKYFAFAKENMPGFDQIAMF